MRLEPALVRAYIDALCEARESGSFKQQAHEMINEVLDSDQDVGTLLTKIDRSPSTPFEKYLRVIVRNRGVR